MRASVFRDGRCRDLYTMSDIRRTYLPLRPEGEVGDSGVYDGRAGTPGYLGPEAEFIDRVPRRVAADEDAAKSLEETIPKLVAMAARDEVSPSMSAVFDLVYRHVRRGRRPGNPDG